MLNSTLQAPPCAPPLAPATPPRPSPPAPVPPRTHVLPWAATADVAPHMNYNLYRVQPPVTFISHPPGMDDESFEAMANAESLELLHVALINGGGPWVLSREQLVQYMEIVAQLITADQKAAGLIGQDEIYDKARSSIIKDRATANVHNAFNSIQADVLPLLLPHIPTLPLTDILSMLTSINKMEAHFFIVRPLLDAIIQHFPKFARHITPRQAAQLLADMGKFSLETCIASRSKTPAAPGKATSGFVKLHYLLLVCEERISQGMGKIGVEQLAGAMYTLADLGPAVYEPSVQLTDAMLFTLVAQMPQMTPSSVAKFTHALGCFATEGRQVEKARLMRGLGDIIENVRSCLPFFDAEELGLALWGLAQYREEFVEEHTGLNRLLQEVDNVLLYLRDYDVWHQTRSRILEYEGQEALDEVDSLAGPGIQAIGVLEQPVDMEAIVTDGPTVDGKEADMQRLPERDGEWAGRLMLEDEVDIFHVTFFCRAFRPKRAWNHYGMERFVPALVARTGPYRKGQKKYNDEMLKLFFGASQLVGECIHYDKLVERNKLRPFLGPGYWIKAEPKTYKLSSRVQTEDPGKDPGWYLKEMGRHFPLEWIDHPVVTYTDGRLLSDNEVNREEVRKYRKQFTKLVD